MPRLNVSGERRKTYFSVLFPEESFLVVELQGLMEPEFFLTLREPSLERIHIMAIFN